MEVVRWTVTDRSSVALVGSPEDLRSLADAIRRGERCGPVDVVSSTSALLDVSDDGVTVVLSGGTEVLNRLASTVKNVAEAAEQVGAGEECHADLDHTNIEWFSPTSMSLEVVGRQQ